MQSLQDCQGTHDLEVQQRKVRKNNKGKSVALKVNNKASKERSVEATRKKNNLPESDTDDLSSNPDDDTDSKTGERKSSGRREGKDSKAEKVDRSKIKCYNCDEPGHFATECKKTKHDKGKNKALITSSKDWMDSTDSENEETCYALMASFDALASSYSKGNKKNTLVLDSGCSGHMTVNKSLLSEFVKKAGPNVSYGDGNIGHTLDMAT
ncbi:hypothetical protein AgCh_009107 [Apium graveolens]